MWVGAEHYSGPIANLLIIAGAMQLAFIRSDGNIIDLTLRMSHKVMLGVLSVVVSLTTASLLVGYFDLGVPGLCVRIMAGRLIISVGYPVWVGRFLGADLSRQVNGLFRPALVTAFLFMISLAALVSSPTRT